MITIGTITIGDNLRSIRRQKGITQEQLAELSGISLNFVSKIERKQKQNISIKTLMALASSLNVEPLDLLKGSKGPAGHRRQHVDLLSRELYKLPEDEAERLSVAFLQVVKATRNHNE